LRLSYSPDAQTLLAILANNRLRLWKPDTRRMLQPQLDIACTLPLDDRQTLLSNKLFSHNRHDLAVPGTSHQIQLWTRTQKNLWQPEDTLTIPPESGASAGDKLRYIQLSSDGRALVRVTHRSFDIWLRVGRLTGSACSDRRNKAQRRVFARPFFSMATACSV